MAGAPLTAADISELLPDAEDLSYEEEILRDPFRVRSWLRYLNARRSAPAKKRRVIYERAVKALPGSYKIWAAYLSERVAAAKGARPGGPEHTALNNTFERALVTMHKMPRVWIMYLEALVAQRRITRTRRAFDRALMALPVTQHFRIWPMYIAFVTQDYVPVDTALRVYRRHLKVEPGSLEGYIDFLVARGRWGEAARQMAAALDDEGFVSSTGKTKHQLWLELCDVATKHPDEVKGVIKVEPVVRGGIAAFTDDVGRLWASLADFYIRQGAFERARDVYEEAMGSVSTVRDFSVVYDAYTQFEESVVATQMEDMADDDGGEGGGAGEGEWVFEEGADDVELRIARLEWLVERRPELLSSVRLRQNPHNVHEWHKRVELFEGDGARQVRTYTEAVKTVDASKAVGKYATLWVEFAKFYEAHGDVANADVIFEKATIVKHRSADELATVWSEWAEMHLRRKAYPRALELARRSAREAEAAAAARRPGSGEPTAQERLVKCPAMWSFLIDMEESLGTIENTKHAYGRCLDLKVATPQMVLNFASFMEEHKFFEESFKVYERGVAAFKYPHAKEIWATYLARFVARFGGTKLERARDLFEQAVAAAPPEHAEPLFLMYAELEENHGLARNALAVYARAAKAVPEDRRLAVYERYVSRAAEFFGATRCREIYEEGIQSGDLPEKDTLELCCRYARAERSLGEVDRARAIYIAGSKLANPAKDSAFWGEWNNFEVQHGNEETFREMLRVKRSVGSAYAVEGGAQAVADKIRSGGAGTSAEGAAAAAGAGAGDGIMAQMEAEAAEAQPYAPPQAAGVKGTGLSGFVSAGVTGGSAGGQGAGATPMAAAEDNPEEIDLDLDGDEGADGGGQDGDGDGDGGGDAPINIQTKAIPEAVFGGVKRAAEGGGGGAAGGGEPMGALERMKRARTG